MVKFFLFAVSRYALFVSYVAVFLAGLSLLVLFPLTQLVVSPVG